MKKKNKKKSQILVDRIIAKILKQNPILRKDYVKKYVKQLTEQEKTKN